MATVRVLKNKIRSIRNTEKITHTMEMIATAKSKVCRDRIEQLQPYGDKLAAVLQDLKGAGDGAEERFALLRRPEEVQREALFIITANRGLCGGYNSNLLSLAEERIRLLERQGIEPEVHMIGKKGIARFKYAGRKMHARYTQFEDKPGFEEAEEVFAPILERFAGGSWMRSR